MPILPICGFIEAAAYPAYSLHLPDSGYLLSPVF